MINYNAPSITVSWPLFLIAHVAVIIMFIMGFFADIHAASLVIMWSAVVFSAVLNILEFVYLFIEKLEEIM